jgi:hypothetical protein
VRFLLRAYPARFRRRYGDELLDLVQASGSPVRDGVNVLLSGLRMRLGTTSFGMATVSAMGLGSVVLGGCVLLGSAAIAAAGGFIANRFRLAIA